MSIRKELEQILGQLDQNNSKDKKNELMKKTETLTNELLEVSNEKLRYARQINSLIVDKNRDFNNLLSKNDPPKEPPKYVLRNRSKSAFYPSASLISDSAKENQEPIEKKKETRGRKPRNPLLLLADQAAKLNQIPVKKQAGKVGDRRKPVYVNKVKQTGSTSKKRTDRRAKSEASLVPSTKVEENEPLYCICNDISEDDMVQCDHDGCSLEWFHFGCVGLKRAPKGKW